MMQISNRMALASLPELELPLFRCFMQQINSFAEANALRTFTNWSKIWEYPWLWFHALALIDWKGKHLVDLGSEISPMPWFLAQLGAKVTLIETNREYQQQWSSLRSKLNVDVEWQIVKSEELPLSTSSADVITSFSVIEHQPNKAKAIAEVVRVLKPQGIFAISYDICEEAMGMTFPEWNGKALSMQEFEDFVWRNPAFATGPSAWNTQDIPEFLRWHRLSAPHHNYVTGAAVLIKQ